MPSLEALWQRAHNLVGARDNAVRQRDRLKADIKALEEESGILSLVQAGFQILLDQEVTAGVQAVQKLLTEGLQTVFTDQNLSVEAEVSLQRGKVSVNLYTKHTRPDGTFVRGDSNDSFGGAVATVQSVLLRIIVMRRRSLRPFIMLDESLPAFDNNYASNMGLFLDMLCSRLGIDLLLVSHSSAMVETARKAYRIVRTPDGARFELLR